MVKNILKIILIIALVLGGAWGVFMFGLVGGDDYFYLAASIYLLVLIVLSYKAIRKQIVKTWRKRH
jgi:uncharacterized membrane protein